LTIEDLQVANAALDLLIRRHPEGVGLEVLRREGDIEVVKSVLMISLRALLLMPVREKFNGKYVFRFT